MSSLAIDLAMVLHAMKALSQDWQVLRSRMLRPMMPQAPMPLPRRHGWIFDLWYVRRCTDTVDYVHRMR